MVETKVDTKYCRKEFDMKTKTLYVDVMLLEEVIKKSGIKIGHIADELALSRCGLWKKMSGKIPFKAAEVSCICNMCHISNDDRAKIFTPKVEEKVD